MLQVIEDGRVCADCAMILANGEDSCEEEREHGRGLPAGAVLEELDDTEFYVPWRPCPGCGTTIAGTWGTYVVLGRAA